MSYKEIKLRAKNQVFECYTIYGKCCQFMIILNFFKQIFTTLYNFARLSG
jgi:hypothetical protein